MFQFKQPKKLTEKVKFTKKKIVLLVSISLILIASLGTTFAYLMDKTDTFTNLFVPYFEHYGTLSIMKEVDHPYGENYRIPDSIKFDFEVALGEEYAERAVAVLQDGETTEVTANEEGVLTLTLRPGSTANLLEITAGTAITVTEVKGADTDDGFTYAQAQTAEIKRNETSEMIFVNKYTPKAVDPVNLNVTGTKVLEGRSWQEGDSFTFLLEHFVYDSTKKENVWEELSRVTVAYDKEKDDYDKFNFNEVMAEYVFDTFGVYEFRISEITDVEDTEGITYDKVVSYFDVTVGDDDMNGSLEINNVEAAQNAKATYDVETGIHTVDVTVTNQYAASGNATAVINIQKIYKNQFGDKLEDASGFSFELYDEYGQKQTSQETFATGETGFVLEFNAGDIGKTFTYTLKEVNAGESIEGLHYDKAEYKLQITVVDDLDGTISTAITAEKIVDGETFEVEVNEEAPDILNVSFENIYDAEDTEVVLSGTKSLSGRNMTAGEFTFNLYKTDADFSVSKNARPIDTAANAGTNPTTDVFTFDTLTYNEPGTYYYVVTEDTSSQLGGMTYDDAKYHVTVIVTDTAGVLSAETKITNALGEPAELTFQNRYVPEITYVTLEGKKILNGAELAEKMFTFNLYQTNETFAVEGEPLKTVTNNADGIFIFDTLTFETAGDYYYVVKEDTSNPVEGMEYDSRIFQIVVKVTDDGQGQLSSETVITADGKQAESIAFENTWTKEEEPVVPGDDPDGTGGTGGLEDPDAADTGDTTNILVYLVGIAVSAVVGVVLERRVKKRR